MHTLKTIGKWTAIGFGALFVIGFIGSTIEGDGADEVDPPPTTTAVEPVVVEATTTTVALTTTTAAPTTTTVGPTTTTVPAIMCDSPDLPLEQRNVIIRAQRAADNLGSSRSEAIDFLINRGFSPADAEFGVACVYG